MAFSAVPLLSSDKACQESKSAKSAQRIGSAAHPIGRKWWWGTKFKSKLEQERIRITQRHKGK